MTGGFSKNETIDSVYAFDVRAKLWLTKTKMNHKRCLHTLNAVDQKLYAIGGKEIGGNTNRSVEEYDPVSNQWSTILIDVNEGLLCVTTGSSCFVYGESIFLFGGGKSPHAAVFHADGDNFIECIGKLPTDYARNVSALLTIPKLL